MKYKILLIQPENKEINRARRKQLNNFVQITMPYLAAFIDETLFDITLVDEYNQSVPFDKSFDLVAITVNTPNARHCYDMAERFRGRGSKIVVGGPHVTLLPDEAAQHADHLVIGEAERTWPMFLKDFASGKAQSRYEDREAPSLDGLPAPRWDLLRHRSRLMKGAVFATRGCPYQCRYCNLKQIYHQSFRTRPIDEVIEEIKSLPSGYFVFWDDNFFADKKYALALMKAMIPLKKRWAAQATLRDCDDDELLDAAGKAGCIYLFAGLESFSRSSLADAGKPVNRVGDYREIIQKVHGYRILIQAGIIFGFDSDAKEVFADTLRACESLGIDGTTASILTPLPGTPIYGDLKRENRLRSFDWHFYNGKTYVAFEPKQMSADELYRGYLWFRRRFYSFRSFLKRMRVSGTRVGYNFLINLGYRLAIRKPRGEDRKSRV